jgi:hypothetical protein
MCRLARSTTVLYRGTSTLFRSRVKVSSRLPIARMVESFGLSRYQRNAVKVCLHLLVVWLVSIILATTSLSLPQSSRVWVLTPSYHCLLCIGCPRRGLDARQPGVAAATCCPRYSCTAAYFRVWGSGAPFASATVAGVCAGRARAAANGG